MQSSRETKVCIVSRCNRLANAAEGGSGLCVQGCGANSTESMCMLLQTFEVMYYKVLQSFIGRGYGCGM